MATETMGYTDEGYEWDEVHEEAPDQIVWDTIGEVYIGTYTGQESIDPKDPKDPDKRFIQLKFRDNEGAKVINAGHELRTAFAEIPTGSLVRIEYVKDVEVKQAAPMKSFNVKVGRPVNKKG